MRHVVVILITLMIFTLWILPAFMIWNHYSGTWGFMYILVSVLSVLWGVLLESAGYFKKQI